MSEWLRAERRAEAVLPGIDDDLGNAVFFVTPDLVHVACLFDSDAMRNKKAGIDLLVLNALEQGTQVLMHMRLAHGHLDALAESRTEIDLVQHAAIDAWDGQGAALTDGLEGLPQNEGAVCLEHERLLHLVVHADEGTGMRVHAHSIDTYDRADTAGEVAKRPHHDDIIFAIVDRGRTAVFTGEAQALREAVDHDDVAGAQHVGTGCGEQSDRTGTPNGNSVALLNVAVLRAHVAGGEDVGQEEHLLIRQVVLELQAADIRVRNAGVLGLSAGVATVDVRVAEERRAGVTVHGLGDLCVRVGVVAKGPEVLLAEEAISAGDGERYNNAVAAL